MRAASCTSFDRAFEFGLLGLMSTPISVAEGTTSRSSSSRFGSSSPRKMVTPVRFPVGRFMLVTTPASMGRRR